MRLLKFAILLAIGTALLVAQVTARPTPDVALACIAFAVYAALGGLIIFRHDGHLTGWLLILLGLTIVLADGIAWIPGVPIIAVEWVASWVWTAVFALFGALTLTFPTGHGPEGGSRTARLGRLTLWALPALVLVGAATQTLGGPESTSQIGSSVGFLPGWLGSVALILVAAILVIGAVSLVVKRRRATGIEHAQLTWVVFGAALLATSVTVTFVYVFASIALGAGDPGDSAWMVVFVVMILFPTSFAVAVLRYRLFGIDRIVSRTVGYTLVAGTLAALYAIVVTLLTMLVSADSDIVVAGSTLVVAALFNPVRRRIQDWADRRFNRSHYDAQQVGDGFAQLVRDEMDLNRIVDGWVDVMSRTIEPTTLGVWLRDDAGAVTPS